MISNTIHYYFYLFRSFIFLFLHELFASYYNIQFQLYISLYRFINLCTDLIINWINIIYANFVKIFFFYYLAFFRVQLKQRITLNIIEYIFFVGASVSLFFFYSLFSSVRFAFGG